MTPAIRVFRADAAASAVGWGAKRSTVATWLTDAVAHGARVYVGVSAHSVTMAGGRATGVIATSDTGATLTVRARVVVSSGGAIETPALLQRSGLRAPAIGSHLRLHPATAVLGLMDEPVRPWEGTMQARVVDRFADLDGRGYGAILETAPITPALGSGFINWRGGAEYLSRMAEWERTVDIAVILRDRDPGGSVRVDRAGDPVVRYRLSDADADHLARGMVGAAELAAAAGARRIRTTHQRDVVYEPGTRGSLSAFGAAIRREGFAPGRLGLVALHIMGSCRMGGSPDSSATDPDGQVWGVDGLYVADASSFPTASGVNPMVSIQAIAYMTAQRIAARLA